MEIEKCSQNGINVDFQQYFTDLLESENANNEEKILHITIPFCDSICTFCNAGRFLKIEDKLEKYVRALKAEIKMYSRTRYINSSVFGALYLHGGTPTVLSSKELCDLLLYCKSNFTLDGDVEITLESTVHNIDEDKVRKLLDCGVDRLYFGVQTFNDTIRRWLNRTNSSEEVAQTIKLAHKLGCNNVRIDLMYNLPGQSIEMWKSDLKKAVDLCVENISIFRFHLYPHLKLAKMIHSGEISPSQGEDIAREMYRKGVEILTEAGYKRQYASGFVLPGKESKYYNLCYKYLRERIGLGTTNWFYSLLGNYIYKNVESLEDYSAYVSAGKFPISIGVKLSKEDVMSPTFDPYCSGVFLEPQKRVPKNENEKL